MSLLDILNPLSLYDDLNLHKLTEGYHNFTKNDNFRLIILTKQAFVTKKLKDLFEIFMIDEDKIDQELKTEEFLRKIPDKNLTAT